MALRPSLITIVALALAAAPCALACKTIASPFYGVPWKSAFDMYSTENGWKRHGGISKIHLYYNKESGCLTGLRIAYGSQGESARLLGADRVGQASAELSLETRELVNDAVIKYSSCVTFLSLTTSKRKVLAIGDASTPGSLQASSPGPGGGFLAYVKAYSDDAAYGTLQRLQLVWATLDCASSPAKAPQPIGAPAAVDKLESALQADPAAFYAMTVNAEPVAATVVSGQGSVTETLTVVDAAAADEAVAAAAPPAEPAPAPAAEPAAAAAAANSEVAPVGGFIAVPPAAEAAATAAVPTAAEAATAQSGACSPGTACKEGVCATSSCAVNGMGKDVLTMMCFGTNIAPNPILDATTGNPCTNLACKLDKPGCMSVGLLGVGGFCSGRVVAMSSTAKLHPVGQNFIGYPCVERKGAVLELLPVGDYTAKGTYAAKAWRVCDCIQGFAMHEGSIGVMARPNGDVSLSTPSLLTLPNFPFVAKGLLNMSLTDVLAQWVGANQANIQLPQVELSPRQITDVGLVLPGFVAPGVVLSRLSAPLFRRPDNLKLPVFSPASGNATLQRLASAIPGLTSLPTLVLPPLKAPGMPTVTVTMPEVTVPNLFDLAPAFGVPTLPKLPPVFNMSFQDAVMQWMAATAMNLRVPELRLQEHVIEGLQRFVDGFVVPALLLPNISAPLFKPPRGLDMPLVVMGGEQSAAVRQFLPRLTALPTFVLPQSFQGILPKLDLPTVTVPNVADVVASLGAQLTKWPQLPFNMPSMNLSMPHMQLLDGLNLQLPSLEALLQPKMPVNATGMHMADLVAPEVTTPNIQLDLSGFQELAAAIKAGFAGQLRQSEGPTSEDTVPAQGGVADSDVAASASNVVKFDAKDVEAAPKVGSSTTTTDTSTTVVTVPRTADTDAAAAKGMSTSTAPTITAAAPLATPDYTVAAGTAGNSSGGYAGEVVSGTEVTVVPSVAVAAAAPVPPVPAPNKRVAESNQARRRSRSTNKQQ